MTVESTNNQIIRLGFDRCLKSTFIRVFIAFIYSFINKKDIETYFATNRF